MGKTIAPGAMALALVVAPALAGHGSLNIIGFRDLEARLGPLTPTGAGVTVATIEVPDAAAYGPNQNFDDFEGKNFMPLSGEPGASSHATTVGKFQYGVLWSAAPGVVDIYLWATLDWTGPGFLQYGAPTFRRPSATPGGIKLMNNSWIANFDNAAANNEVLRRADFVVNRDDVVMTNGVNNDFGPAWPVVSQMYNGISAGLIDGTHTSVPVPPSIEGAGRMKPEIVGPEGGSSFATAKLNACGSLLVETARTWNGLADNPNAERTEVIKAILLAGAVHEDQVDGVWSNGASTSGPDRGVTATPIDAVMGVGTMNIDRSHMIMTGYEQDGDDLRPDEATIGWAGWDFVPVEVGRSAFYRIDVPETADEVSIVATWHRIVGQNLTSWSVADMDLVLWGVDEQDQLLNLVGDDGLGVFGGGNVVSESAVDNVEHLYVTDLQPGSYVIELRRTDALPTTFWDAGIAWIFPRPDFAPEDVDEDGIVGFQDLLAVLTAWGDCFGCPEDIDGDGIVGFQDLLAVLAAWS